VEAHDRLKKIEEGAFYSCPRLRRLTKMNGVIEIEEAAFHGIWKLTNWKLLDTVHLLTATL
jgi:hypothetical protein